MAANWLYRISDEGICIAEFPNVEELAKVDDPDAECHFEREPKFGRYVIEKRTGGSILVPADNGIIYSYFHLITINFGLQMGLPNIDDDRYVHMADYDEKRVDTKGITQRLGL